MHYRTEKDFSGFSFPFARSRHKAISTLVSRPYASLELSINFFLYCSCLIFLIFSQRGARTEQRKNLRFNRIEQNGAKGY